MENEEIQQESFFPNLEQRPRGKRGIGARPLLESHHAQAASCRCLLA
jgi:hypothetical protein